MRSVPVGSVSRRSPLACSVLLVALGLGTLAGCKTKQPAAREVTPPTAQEAELVGKQFAKSLGPCNQRELDKMIDTDLLVSRAVAHRSMHSNEVRGLARGIGTMGQRLCMELGSQNVNATYLRTRVVNGAPRPLVRLVFDAGLNYYELELDKRGDDVRVADMYLYLAGENMSETIGRVLDVVLTASARRSLPTATIQQMKQHMRDGEWTQARTLLESLPKALRQSKPVRLIELQIASELGDDDYLAVMESYTKAYPNDPSLALIQIDRRLLKKQYTEALAAFDELDKLVGGDPYIDALRVDAYMSLGKPAEAIAAAKRGIAVEPELEQLWWALLSAQAMDAQYAEAIPTVETLRAKFGADVAALGDDERFTELAASEPFQKWMASSQP